ncbi:MAG: molybdate ABC transporter substrate-binding protein [Pseudomonadota bacterium]
MLIALLLAPFARADTPAATVTVFAAASLKTALDEIGASWEAKTGTQLRAVFAGSATLARQIEAGAAADVVISANPGWMDHLEAQGLIDAASRFDLAGNRLALIGFGPQEPVEIGPGLDLAGLLGSGRLAMALVDAVPAGIYGKAALHHLGLWDGVAAQVAQADNVRAALALVAAGAAPLGIVYVTDAAAEPRVGILGVFPETAHPPILYPAAATADAGPVAQAFMVYLRGAEARAALTRQGFTEPG